MTTKNSKKEQTRVLRRQRKTLYLYIRALQQPLARPGGGAHVMHFSERLFRKIKDDGKHSVSLPLSLSLSVAREFSHPRFEIQIFRCRCRRRRRCIVGALMTKRRVCIRALGSAAWRREIDTLAGVRVREN